MFFLIILATWHGQTEIVSLLMLYGVDQEINHQIPKECFIGCTALMLGYYFV